MVYELKKYGLRVSCHNASDIEPTVELALGSELRTLPLREFIELWLSMVELGRQATRPLTWFFSECRHC